MAERDAVSLTVFVLGRFTQMPDLLDFFGYDTRKFLEFVDRFGGMTISLPGREQVGRLARNMNIYRSLRRNRNIRTVENLAHLYGLTNARIGQIFAEVIKEVQDLDERSGDDTDEVIAQLR